MKRTFRTLGLMAVMTLISFSAYSQSEGTVVYSLPGTSLHLTVETIRESYTPGPYSKYAKKYLGIEVSDQTKDTYSLMSVKLTPYLEADRSKSYVVNVSGASASAFFSFSSQGLILLSDANKGQSEYWRFPTLAENNQIEAREATQNLTSTETTLYKNVKNAQGGYDRVAVQQSQVVEKSLEKKAAEAANMIFSLRKKRVEIITGDTDATFSGEALKAAIDEISRLEDSYLSLFIGTTQSAVQTKEFDVIPKADMEKQMYVAFRMSDTQGLLAPGNVSGRPIVMELVPEESAPAVQELPATNSKSSKSKGAPSPENMITYRIPQICQVKIMDGSDMLLHTRVPVYQLGETLTFPIDIISSK